MSTRNLSIAVGVIVLLVLAGWLLVKSQQSQVPVIEAPVAQTPEPLLPTTSPSAVMSEAAVTISSAGFTPKDISVKVGETVTWTNSDTKNHTVDSAPHPVHTDYTPLNLSTIAPGTSKSLVFPTAGTYKYHDHQNPSNTGSVTVE